MKRTIRISEPASAELTAAVEWYESQRPGLGAELFVAVAVIDQPEIGSPVLTAPQRKRILVARFPYQVVYHLGQNELTVLAMAQMKRRPGCWKQRR